MYPLLLCVCVNFLLMCYCSIAFVWLHTWESFIRTSLQCIHFSKDLAITIIPNIEKYIKVSRVLLDQWTSISLAERTHPVGITHVPRRANVMSGASYATLPCHKSCHTHYNNNATQHNSCNKHRHKSLKWVKIEKVFKVPGIVKSSCQSSKQGELI